jgi:hypothetical protein
VIKQINSDAIDECKVQRHTVVLMERDLRKLLSLMAPWGTAFARSYLPLTIPVRGSNLESADNHLFRSKSQYLSDRINFRLGFWLQSGVAKTLER